MNVKSWFRELERPVEPVPLCSGSAVGCSFRCPGKESNNEDAAVTIELSPTHGVLAVADGVGGQNAGDRAAQITIEAIIDHCQSAEPGGHLRSQIVDAIESANREILNLGVGAGATLVVAEYRDKSVRLIHVGDASGLLLSNRGRIKFFTVAHAPVAMAVEIGVLDESEALNHEDRNLISNCVGCHEMKIEIGPRIPMAKRDSLVIASDGLFDNLTCDEISNLLRVGNLKRQATKLIDLTRKRMKNADEISGKPDDLTVICFRQQQNRSKDEA